MAVDVSGKHFHKVKYCNWHFYDRTSPPSAISSLQFVFIFFFDIIAIKKLSRFEGCFMKNIFEEFVLEKTFYKSWRQWRKSVDIGVRDRKQFAFRESIRRWIVSQLIKNIWNIYLNCSDWRRRMRVILWVRTSATLSVQSGWTRQSQVPSEPTAQILSHLVLQVGIKV